MSSLPRSSFTRRIETNALFLLDARLSPAARLLYQILVAAENESSVCAPSDDEVRARLGCGESALRRHRRELIDVGLIVVHDRGRGLTDQYTFSDPRLARFVPERSTS